MNSDCQNLQIFCRKAVEHIEDGQEFLYLKTNLLIQKLAGIYNAQIPYKTTENFSHLLMH